MSYRLNKDYIREYAAEVASIICEDFYKKNNRVEGKHLVNLTEIRQVNLFLVKKMYLRWQEEGAALHSPYFNYAAPEVRQIFNKLMNVLSKNISISQNDFEPFLASSIKETLSFLIDPPTYFETLFDGFSGKIYVKSQIFPLKKYYRYHFPLIEKYFEALQEEANKLKAKKALKVLNKCMEKYPALLSNTSEVVSEFDVYKPFILDKAYIQEDDIEEEQLDFSENDFNIKGEQEEHVVEEGSQTAEMFDYEDFSDEEEKLGKTVKVEKSPVEEIVEENTPLSEEKTKEITSEKVEDPKETAEITETKAEEEQVGVESEQSDKQTSDPWGEAEKMLNINKTESEKQEVSSQSEDELKEEEAPLENTLETEGDDSSGFNDFMIRDEIEEEATGITKADLPDTIGEEEKSDESEGEEPRTLLEKLQQGKQQETTEKKPLFSTEEEDEEEEEKPNAFSTIQDKIKLEQEVHNRKLLRGNIPLNMKLRYKKELFGDDQAEFENAIDMIDKCKDYHEAISFLKSNFVTKYNWDFSEESTRDFLSMVDNNFN